MNEGKKRRGRVFITDGRTVGWMKKKRRERERERERERPDLLQCDPLI